MKVFISHPIKDEDLAMKLKKILEESPEIEEAFIAQKIKKYEIEISQKIIEQITESDCLVAIITTNSKNSASVNQELGFAQGIQKPKIPMIEKNAKKGFLIHGKDVEEFDRENFEEICIEVRNNVLKYKLFNPKSIDSEKFLMKRNLLSDNINDFGKNSNSNKLENSVFLSELTKKPMVLFSACPKKLLTNIPITKKEFEKWLEEFRTIKTNELEIRFLNGFKRVDLNSITYHYPTSNKYTEYLEFVDNGFIEQGFTKPFIYPRERTNSSTPLLHLCWITGAFIGFLSFCQKYYEYLHFHAEFDVMISIKHSNELMLMGFGGKLENGRKWAEPTDDLWWYDKKPYTDYPKISLKKEINSSMLSEEKIGDITREFSDKISNAYGIEFARCYDFDGTLNRESIMWYNRNTL